MTQHLIKFNNIGRGYYEHRCRRWLLRIEPIDTSWRQGNIYRAVFRPRDQDPIDTGPFGTVRGAKAWLLDQVKQQKVDA